METDTQPTSPTVGSAGHKASTFDRHLLFLIFFFVVFAFLLYQFARILSPFASALVGAMILALIFNPLHERVGKRVRSESMAAATTTLIVLLTIVVPIVILLWLMVSEAITAVPLVENWLSEHDDMASLSASLHLPAPLQRLWNFVVGYSGRWQVDLRSVAIEALKETGNTVTSFGAAAVKQFFVFIMNLIVLMLTLFFLLRDGTHIVEWIMDLVPMEETNKRMILGRLERTLSAIIRGAFITSGAQGTLTGIGLAVAGVPFAVLFGFLAALFSVVPMVGCSLVWLPAAGYLLLKGSTAAGIGLIIWGVVVVGTVDNFLRPYVVGGQAQLPILLLLVGILGGIRVYGLIGALIAPLIIALVLAFAQIYREQYLSGRGQVPVKAPAKA